MDIGEYIYRGVQGGAQALAGGYREGQRLRVTRDLAAQENQLRRDLASADQHMANKKLAIEQGRAEAYKNWMDHQTWMGVFDRGWDDLPGWMEARIAQFPVTPSGSVPVNPPPSRTPGKLRQMGIDASGLAPVPRLPFERMGY